MRKSGLVGPGSANPGLRPGCRWTASGSGLSTLDSGCEPNPIAAAGVKEEYIDELQGFPSAPADSRVLSGHACLLRQRRAGCRRRAVGRWEMSLEGTREGNPYLDVELSCTFRHEGKSVTVRGFYDGEGVYKVRFSPPSRGPWRFQTRSNRPELDGKDGSFAVAPPATNNHGPVQVFEAFYLCYADGTPYHQFGTTCYAWVHQPRELQEQTLKTLAAAPFNKIRFCVFPKSYYVANKNEPDLFAFRKKADGKFDFSRPEPEFWRHFEGRILDLQKLGIEADIILWHPYDRWGFSAMSDADDDRYLRYCIARFSAYRNVWWSLANEYDFMTDRRPGGHGGNKQWEDWDRFFSILQKDDPHHGCAASTTEASGTTTRRYGSRTPASSLPISTVGFASATGTTSR